MRRKKSAPDSNSSSLSSIIQYSKYQKLKETIQATIEDDNAPESNSTSNIAELLIFITN